MDQLGYEPVSNLEEADYRLVAVAAQPWVSVFDMASPGAMTEESVTLGRALSSAASSPVLLTTVYDSDGFGFLLFDKGKQVDGHASMRGLLPGRVKKWPAEKRAQEWRRLFARSFSQADFEALTERGMLFADDLLMRLCDLLGIARGLATTTTHDLQARPLANQQEFCFRSRPIVGDGPPVKQTVPSKAKVARLQLPTVSEHSIAFELNAPAGAFVDPVVEFSGPAVDAGLIALTDSSAGSYGLWAMGLEAIKAGDIRKVQGVLSSAELEGKRVLRACLQGLSAGHFGFPPRKKSILIFWTRLRAVAKGAGELHACCLPNGGSMQRLALQPVFQVEITA